MGKLGEIESRVEKGAILGHITMEARLHDKDFWIGITDSKEEGFWRYASSDNRHVMYTAWANREPDDWGKGEDCTELIAKLHPTRALQWGDVPCTSLRTPLCEKVGPTLNRHISHSPTN